MIPRFLVFAMTLLLIPPRAAFSQESDPAALAIFDAALDKIEARAIPLKKWQYRQTLTTHQLDSDGETTARGTWISIYRPGEKDPVEYVSEDLQGSLTFFHKSTDETKKKAAAAPDPKPAAAEENDESSTNNRLDSLADAVRKYSLRDRYLWTALPDEKVVGEKAAVIAFNPKPGLTIKTREQRFFSQLSGKIWVSREDSTVLKSEGALLEPYRLFWVIARITKLEFAYEVEPSPASRLLRKSKANAETIVSFPFKTVRQKHWLDVVEYEPRTPRK